MEVSFNLLKLKLDMVYRDMPLEEAEKRFAEATAVPEGNTAPEPGLVETRVLEPKKPKRKVVKALLPTK